MPYGFIQVGFFETLDGNALRGTSEDRDDRPRTRNRLKSNEKVREELNDTEAPTTPPEALRREKPPVMVPTETGFRQHKGPTITMPRAAPPPRAAASAVDLTAESSRSKALNSSLAGWTPLCTAAHQGKFGSVKLLLEQKANPNMPNSHGTLAYLGSV